MDVETGPINAVLYEPSFRTNYRYSLENKLIIFTLSVLLTFSRHFIFCYEAKNLLHPTIHPPKKIHDFRANNRILFPGGGSNSFLVKYHP